MSGNASLTAGPSVKRRFLVADLVGEDKVTAAAFSNAQSEVWYFVVAIDDFLLSRWQLNGVYGLSRQFDTRPPGTIMG
jgi:hypothetical protein